MTRQARINREKGNDDAHRRSHYGKHHHERSHIENQAWRQERQNSATKAAKKRDRATAERKSQSQREPGGTKKEIVLELLRRKDGATIADIVKATDWQNHSIREFISG